MSINLNMFAVRPTYTIAGKSKADCIASTKSQLKHPEYLIMSTNLAIYVYKRCFTEDQLLTD